MLHERDMHPIVVMKPNVITANLLSKRSLQNVLQNITSITSKWSLDIACPSSSVGYNAHWPCGHWATEVPATRRLVSLARRLVGTCRLISAYSKINISQASMEGMFMVYGMVPGYQALKLLDLSQDFFFSYARHHHEP